MIKELHISGGLDSTAMLCLMHENGELDENCRFVFADTGWEWPETYLQLDAVDSWLAERGLPLLIRTRYKPVNLSRYKFGVYDNLLDNVRLNKTLPSLAFGMHGCAIKFKARPMWLSLMNHIDLSDPSPQALVLIGYDAGPADLKRAEKFKSRNASDREKAAASFRKKSSVQALYCDYDFPLQKRGMSRNDLPKIISRNGLPVPPKSACMGCPAAHVDEVLKLRDMHPEHFKACLEIERGFLGGPFGPAAREKDGKKTSTVGLGRNWSWEWIAECCNEPEALALIKSKTGKAPVATCMPGA